MTFAEAVRAILKEKGLTQEELATKSGIRLRQLQRYIANQRPQVPSMPQAEAIARGLGVSISRLIDEGDITPEYSDDLPPALAEFFGGQPDITDEEKGHLRRYYRDDGPVTDPVLLSGILTQYRLVQRQRNHDAKQRTHARKESESARRELETEGIKVMSPAKSPRKGR